MKIANPIYDIVFKYLMEDERIARTILSALLRMEVTRVEQRRNEYVKGELKGLTLSRIDFGATVLDESGEERLMLVELQKTWVETETLRFRQYLAEQYNDRENMARGPRSEYALPMVTVYLLGHLVGDIEEPVLYVRQKAYDYQDRPVTKGLPDPFVESLTHDSIIVQIPRLHGQINNRLDKVLSIFDQNRRDSDDEQLLSIDERAYTDDSAMERILHRLTMAAADAAVRHRMDVEDEYFSIIEKRDTEILLKDKQLAERNVMIAQKDKQLQEQSEQLQEQSEQLQEKDSQLQEQREQLRQTVKLLIQASVPSDLIASRLNITQEDVERMAGEG